MKSSRIMTTIMMVWIVVFSLHIISCGQKGERPDAEETDSPAMTAQTMSVSLSQPTVKTDDSDSCTITVVVLDKDRVGIPDLDVSFSAAGGLLSASTVTTDSETAKAEVLFSAGSDKENKVVTVTVSVAGLTPVPVPIQLVETTITLETSTANLQIGGTDSDTIALTLKDAGDAAISDEDVTVAIDSSSTGNATLLCAAGDLDCSASSNVLTLTTNFNGQAEFDVQGVSQGSVTIVSEALGAKGYALYTVGIKGTSFGISSPTADPYSWPTSKELTIVVDAPGVTDVRFATTLGTWQNGMRTFTDYNIQNGISSATLISTIAGVATVQVFDVANSMTQDSLNIAISAPTGEASQVDIQASPSVVALSSGGLDNKVTLTATVKNDSDQPVGGAPVAFSIVNPIGGGEKIYPVIASTDNSGEATTTFTSGSIASDSTGVIIMVEVLTGEMPTDTTAVLIGGKAGSINISPGTVIESINNDTAYKLPMGIIVTDANGNPVKGVKVSLGSWPSRYRKGYWEEIEPGKCVARPETEYINEDDLNLDASKQRNLILDEGEDLNSDGQLTPENTTSGALPSTVTTDENGLASFDLIYLKTSAVWIEAEITASALVLGDQSRSTLKFWLNYLKGEECALPHSPYGRDEVVIPVPVVEE